MNYTKFINLMYIVGLIRKFRAEVGSLVPTSWYIGDSHTFVLASNAINRGLP